MNFKELKDQAQEIYQESMKLPHNQRSRFRKKAVDKLLPEERMPVRTYISNMKPCCKNARFNMAEPQFRERTGE